MKPPIGLYKPISFLAKYPYLSEKKVSEDDMRLSLRFFSIMQDIAVVYTWINSSTILGSGHIKPYQRNMLQYYKGNLDSSTAQSLMILMADVQIFQVDLFPSLRDPLHNSLATGSNDVTIKY